MSTKIVPLYDVPPHGLSDMMRIRILYTDPFDKTTEWRAIRPMYLRFCLSEELAEDISEETKRVFANQWVLVAFDETEQQELMYLCKNIHKWEW